MMTHWIALTGGIGSGKSTVAELFFDRHRITTIDSDIVARKLTAANGQAIPLIRQAFGDDFIDISGSLNTRIRSKYDYVWCDFGRYNRLAI